ncbi:MAG: DUF58 domain-containing protein [Planctomycetia bacterium]|nr:DUF58 domain-containing protein [Planctomycetia bacterium]
MFYDLIKYFPLAELEEFISCFYGLFLLFPLLIVALLCKTAPAFRGILLFSTSILFSLPFFILNAFEGIYLLKILDFVLIALFLADFCFAISIRGFSGRRIMEKTASLGRDHQIVIRLENRSRSARTVCISDDVLSDLNNQDGFFKKEEIIPAGKSLELDYRFKPLVRGAFLLEKIYLAVYSPLRLWKKEIVLPVKDEINVYPDLRQISEYELLARSERLHMLGLRKSRRIGQDNDFERLRDYTLDDQYKFIDWRATARRNKLTVKDFQMSKSQRIIFMIDTGRMMNHTVKGIACLDYAFNSMLMLAYIALKQGDEVGFLAFSDDIRQYIAPRGGLSQMNHLIHGCFNIFPESVESRYDQAFAYLDTHCRKRSLVVFISNIIDQRNSGQIEARLHNLGGRHLPLGILLRDHLLFDPLIRQMKAKKDLKTENSDFQEQSKEAEIEFYRSGAAGEILAWRCKVLKQLSSNGALTLDVFPEELTVPLINKYLQIKAQHLL